VSFEEQNQPPGWSRRFLRWFCRTEYYEDIQGDLDEEYYLYLRNHSTFQSRYWYNMQIIRLFRPSMMNKIKTKDSIEKEITMIKNYLKIGFRNLWKYKSSSTINVIGLSTGLAAFILIALFVRDEFSYDKHFQGAEDIYRVTVQNFTTEGDLSRHWAFASAGHAERLKNDYSTITHAARFHAWVFPDIDYKEQKFPGEQVIFADDDVFDIFSFEFLIGDPNTALNDLYSIVLTRATAIKIFGNDWMTKDIIGETVTLSRSGQSAPFKVTGVMEDMPDQQHFHFEYLAPLRFLEMLMGEQTMQNVGGNYNWLTYVRVSPGTDIPQLTSSANDEFWDKYIGEIRNRSAADFYQFEFQPLLAIHLHSNLEGEFETNGSLQQVYIFSIIGILLLLVACVNYMNLATSHYSRRMKEVGVRKVVGAVKSSLIKQFLIESLLISIISLPLAILFAYGSLGYLNDFVGKNLAIDLVGDLPLLLGIICLLFFVGVVAGLYPAVFLSKINLIQALKGEQSMNSSKWNFRSWLVTFQYAVTIGLIFTIMVIEGQMQFIRNSDSGYRRDQIINVSLTSNINNLDLFRNEMLAHPNIVQAGFASRIPTGRLMDSMGSSFYKGDSLTPTNFRLPFIGVDENFIETFEIPLIAGENFKRQQNSYEDSVGYYIINRKAAEAFGYNDPNEIIGKPLAYGSFNGQNLQIGRILGVTEDFHFESMHSEIKPMLMLKSKLGLRRMVLKINPVNVPETIKYIESKWMDFDPVNTLNYRFVDDIFEDQYQAEERLSLMIKVFTVIAILIGCLGLFGMVGFIIETKLKEIGIRKVLGASTQNIFGILSTRFLVLIGIAFLIAMPVTYWLMNDWLQNFVYRTNISIFSIGLPLVLATLLTFIAISYQTIRASMVNPVECLKDE
jgi:putative ABC transport system permease protein